MQALVVPTATIIAVGAPAASPPGERHGWVVPTIGNKKGRALGPAFLYLPTVVKLDQWYAITVALLLFPASP